MTKNNIIVMPGEGKVIRGTTVSPLPVRRTADLTKPKVRLDGTPDPTCPTCPKKPPTP